MQENMPSLLACKPLQPTFNKFKKISITSNGFSIGRALQNSVVIPFIAISRNHCIFKMKNCNWIIEDYSTCGIIINKVMIGKGRTKQLVHGDIIEFEPSGEFVFMFHNKFEDTYESPIKRRKLDDVSNSIITNVRMKFEASQSFELKNIEEKIENAKRMQTNSLLLKQQLEIKMNDRIRWLESDFAQQIESLKGEKNEVEKQKALLLGERDQHLAKIKLEMEYKVKELTEQIQKHNKTETELLQENSSLKEKLEKEREDFLSELNRENSSKQDMLKKLEDKINEQEELRLKQKQELEEMQQKVEELMKAKEQELKELEEQKMLQLEQEKAAIQKQADHSLEKLRQQVSNRETELAALAAERIQLQAEQSTKVITQLQEQLEEARGKLQTIESEKNSLLEKNSEGAGEGTSKQNTLTEVGELMESELQCSICAELFVCATTLNCSHTFCKYCITMWKKKKKDCPICRSPIVTECKSLVLDSFIEKMVQNLTEEMKFKRLEMLAHREELQAELTRQLSVGTSRGSNSFEETNSVSSYFTDEGEEEEEEEYNDDEDDWPSSFNISSDSNSGSDDSTRSVTPFELATAFGATVPFPEPTRVRVEQRRRIPGTGYYGGYGRCFKCGARGHWAPGCPFR